MWLIVVVAAVLTAVTSIAASRYTAGSRWRFSLITFIPIYLICEVAATAVSFQSICSIFESPLLLRGTRDVRSVMSPNRSGSCDSLCLEELLTGGGTNLVIYLKPNKVPFFNGWVPSDIDPGFYQLSLANLPDPKCNQFRLWSESVIDSPTAASDDVDLIFTVELLQQFKAQGKCVAIDLVDGFENTLEEGNFQRDFKSTFWNGTYGGTTYRWWGRHPRDPEESIAQINLSLSPRLPVTSALLALTASNGLACHADWDQRGKRYRMAPPA